MRSRQRTRPWWLVGLDGLAFGLHCLPADDERDAAPSASHLHLAIDEATDHILSAHESLGGLKSEIAWFGSSQALGSHAHIRSKGSLN